LKAAEILGDFRNDLKYSLRMLMASPAFTVTAIAALALGIGANTAIFTVVDTVLLKPLTYPDSDRLVRFVNTSPDGTGYAASPENYNAWRAQASVFQDVAAYDPGGPGFNLTGSIPEQVHGIHVSEAYFRLFGAPVLLGRTLTPQEDSPDGGHAVVLSYGFWQRKFGGNPKIVGSAISLSNESYTVVGVLGRDFFTDPATDLWVPFQLDPNSTNLGHYFYVAGRLKPGVTLALGNAALKLTADQFRRLHPEEMDAKDSFGVLPLRDSIVAGARTSLLVLLGAVSFVLLIACANVANLLLVRAAGRKREFAIRAAMGASRLRIMRQLLTESVVLAVTGGILGLALGYLGVRAARGQPSRSAACRRTRRRGGHGLARTLLHARYFAAHWRAVWTFPRHRSLAS
jgi:putative ABC transport system permease protein